MPDPLVPDGDLFRAVREGRASVATDHRALHGNQTLKVDLTSHCACRLLAHRERHGCTRVVPQRDPSVAERPFIDFSSGYVQRALAILPRQGDRAPWRLYQDDLLDWVSLRWQRLDDGVLRVRETGPDPAAPEGRSTAGQDGRSQRA